MNSSTTLPTARFREGCLELIDQTLLPAEYKILRLDNVSDICEAIRRLSVRGAPALGVAGAYGLLVSIEEKFCSDGFIFDSGAEGQGARSVRTEGIAGVDVTQVQATLVEAGKRIEETRPTAVNLGWAIRRMKTVWEKDWNNVPSLLGALIKEADLIHDEDLSMCRTLSTHGAELIPNDARVVTHCNTGGLATSGYGTALGVVFAAVESGKTVEVFADETRPLLQGGRLTAWECSHRNIPVTVLVDGAAASLMAKGDISCAIVGADRIASNGDTANKVGTLGLAIVARRYNVPFYVAAPSSTIDSTISSGSEIPIEQRVADEVRMFAGNLVTPPNVEAYNPAFDITPADLITAIITEHGVVKPPFDFV